MRMSDWSSDVCSSDLITPGGRPGPLLASADMLIATIKGRGGHAAMPHDCVDPIPVACEIVTALQTFIARQVPVADPAVLTIAKIEAGKSEEHTSELQSLMRISYAVFCLKKKKKTKDKEQNI